MGLVVQGLVVHLFPPGLGGSLVAFEPLSLALGREGEGRLHLCPVRLWRGDLPWVLCLLLVPYLGVDLVCLVFLCHGAGGLLA